MIQGSTEDPYTVQFLEELLFEDYPQLRGYTDPSGLAHLLALMNAMLHVEYSGSCESSQLTYEQWRNNLLEFTLRASAFTLPRTPIRHSPFRIRVACTIAIGLCGTSLIDVFPL